MSIRGRQYSNALAKFIHEQNIPNLRVWTSCMKRTIQTAAGINAVQERWKALNEIDAVSPIEKKETFDPHFPLYHREFVKD